MSSEAHQVVVIEVPLLDKPGTQVDYGLDVVVLVDTPEDMAVSGQWDRGMTETGSPRPHGRPAIAARNAGCWPTGPWSTTGDEADLEIAVDELWGWLLAKAPHRDSGRQPGAGPGRAGIVVTRPPVPWPPCLLSKWCQSGHPAGDQPNAIKV